MKVIKIISGGQTGADMGGLIAAKDCGIPTGGHAPRGFWTEHGPNTKLADFGLEATYSSSYTVRTRLNTENSDVTIIFNDAASIGSNLTEDYCKSKNKLFLTTTSDVTSDKLIEFLKECATSLGKDDLVVNIAGNRESKSPGIEIKVKKLLITVFNSIK